MAHRSPVAEEFVAGHVPIRSRGALRASRSSAWATTPAVTSCAIQRNLCTEFIRNKTWEFWYPVAERFDDEGESGATLERPGLAKLLRRIEGGDIHRVIVYRVDRLTRRLADLARLASHFERHLVGLTIVYGNIDADAGSLAGLQVNMLATFAECFSALQN